MNDQATAVDPEKALFDALGDDTPPEETPDETVEVTEEETPEETEQPTEGEPEKFKITVKGDDGKDTEQEVTLDDLAKGYMLQADYTRKTQEVAKERQRVEAEYSTAVAKTQQSAIESIGQLQELVIQQAAPELNGVDWVSLSVQDPARFVQLQAKQQQLQGTLQALEQHKTQYAQQREALIDQKAKEALKISEQVISDEIKDMDASKVEKLLKSVEKHIGWTANDLNFAVRKMAEAGMHPQTLGKILVLAHQASLYQELKSAAPTALKKVAVAPKVIRPSAPQPKQTTNKAALERLQKYGRGEDFMKFL